ncbi:hypothetical protein GC248_01185 [Acetobacter senegalensis]|nr:hypothetical protein [Acetobacter senegalensis]
MQLPAFFLAREPQGRVLRQRDAQQGGMIQHGDCQAGKHTCSARRTHHGRYRLVCHHNKIRAGPERRNAGLRIKRQKQCCLGVLVAFLAQSILRDSRYRSPLQPIHAFRCGRRCHQRLKQQARNHDPVCSVPSRHEVSVAPCLVSPRHGCRAIAHTQRPGECALSLH